MGSTSLITGTYEPSEKAKVQSTNDFLVYGAMVLAAFLAGSLEEFIGWRAINEVALAALTVSLVALSGLWIYGCRRESQTG